MTGWRHVESPLIYTREAEESCVDGKHYPEQLAHMLESTPCGRSNNTVALSSRSRRPCYPCRLTQGRPYKANALDFVKAWS